MNGLIRAITELTAKVSSLERRLDGMLRFGAVKHVDPSEGTVVLEAGVDHETPALPYSQQGGALSIHAAPSQGQHMLLLCPGGDLRNGVAIPAGYGGSFSSPSASGAENVLRYGAVTFTIMEDGLRAQVGGASLTMSGNKITVDGAAVEFNGPSVEHGGTNIGKDHKHTKVKSGLAVSGEPE